MSQFMIYSDDVDENVNVNVAVTRKNGHTSVLGVRGQVPQAEQHMGKQQQGKGVLGNLSNATRIQPQRAVKSSKVQTNDFENAEAYYKSQSFIDLIGGIKPSITVVPQAPPQPVAFTIFEDECDLGGVVNKSKCVGSQITKVEHNFKAIAQPPALVALEQSPMKVDDVAEPVVMEVDTKVGVVESKTGVVGDGRAGALTARKMKERLIEERLNHVLFLPQYRDEIYRNMREAELRYLPRTEYMRRQSDLTYNMRSILVDWLVEVAEEYRLHRETLFLAVNYVDRFLSCMAVIRNKLQLVGAAAIFLASKYEEIYPPDVSEFVYITDDTYSKKQILQMEKIMLKALVFDVAAPTASWFCQDVLNEIDATEEVCCLAMYLLELTLMDGEHFLKYLPSIVATTCVCMANYTLGYSGSMKTVIEITGYDSYDLKHCTLDLFYCFHGVANHAQQAIFLKYKHSKFHAASLIVPPTLPPRVYE